MNTGRLSEAMCGRTLTAANRLCACAHCRWFAGLQGQTPFCMWLTVATRLRPRLSNTHAFFCCCLITRALVLNGETGLELVVWHVRFALPAASCHVSDMLLYDSRHGDFPSFLELVFFAPWLAVEMLPSARPAFADPSPPSPAGWEARRCSPCPFATCCCRKSFPCARSCSTCSLCP